MQGQGAASGNAKELHALKPKIQCGWQGPNDFHELQSPGTTTSERVVDPDEIELVEVEQDESMTQHSSRRNSGVAEAFPLSQPRTVGKFHRGNLLAPFQFDEEKAQ